MIELGRYLRERGVWLTLASARPPRSVQTIAKILNAEGPLISLNGAIVVSGVSHVIWRRSIPAGATAEICRRYSRRPNTSINIYSGFNWIVSNYDLRVVDEAKIVGFEPTLIASDTRDWPTADKILLIVNVGDEDAVRFELLEISSDINVSISKPSYIEITHRDVDKGNALSIAASIANIDMESVLAAGDGENDIPMLSLCGFPVAMAHSPTSVRRVARHVVGTNDDESLPQFIRSMMPLIEGVE